jgi:methylthioribose-1-phosphate isomerase
MTTDKVLAIRWVDDQLELLDQRVLPAEETWLRYGDVAGVVEAIRSMVVRGAPAIGITAAYGVVLAGRHAWQEAGEDWFSLMPEAMDALAASRPTAVNLFWALERMQGCLDSLPDHQSPEAALLTEARAIHAEDLQANHRMGSLGAAVISRAAMPGRFVLTHCNTGALATGGFGTALGVIREAWTRKLIDGVHADETRPWLQGSRLTAWELLKEGVPVTLNADSAAAQLMASGRIGWVIVGADRITANGDVANKIGTYALAVLARYHGVKFMVVAPTSTFDLSLADGSQIPIEERGPAEVLSVQGKPVAPQDVPVFNPVFDVTPASLIDVIVTERGIIEKPDAIRVGAVVAAV